MPDKNKNFCDKNRFRITFEKGFLKAFSFGFIIFSKRVLYVSNNGNMLYPSLLIQYLLFYNQAFLHRKHVSTYETDATIVTKHDERKRCYLTYIN